VKSSDFHLVTEFEGDADARTARMAAAFEAGLRHCATDPLIRLKMILGETYAEYIMVVDKLRDKLAAESQTVRALADKIACDASILDLAIGDPHIASIQQDLLAAALDPP
jgi:hypothetical protein